MRKFAATIALIGICVLSGIAVSVPAAAQRRNISVKGSDTLVILGQRWAEWKVKSLWMGRTSSLLKLTSSRCAETSAWFFNSRIRFPNQFSKTSPMA
jgi:hypothetical protein